MGIADRNAAAEERSRSVLNVLHLLELRDEIGPNEPTVSGVWFREAKLFESAGGGPPPPRLLRLRRLCMPGLRRMESLGRPAFGPRA